MSKTPEQPLPFAKIHEILDQRNEAIAACKLALKAGITYSKTGIAAVAALKAAIAKAEKP